jgi:endonuclease YncB( thermonuclease family)
MTPRALLLLLLVLSSAHATAATQSFDARVIGVADGDTVTVLDANNLQHKIRVAGIDAPEKGQPFGDRSKQSLSRAVMGKPVRVEWQKQDRYGRLVGKVWVAPPDATCRQPPCPKTLDAGLAQLTVGLAWHFKKYENEQSEEDRLRYAFAEEEARARKAGLWSQPDPIPPWDWRNGPKDGPVKKSKSGICHAPDSPSYASVKKFEAFPTLEACLASGGRLPKQPGQ